MIRFGDVSKVHGRRKILEGVGLRARPGQVTNFVRPNGAGKSSSPRILLGLDRVAAGCATLDGRPYQELWNPLRHVGSTLDGAAAHPSRTAHIHLGWAATSNGIPREGVQQILEEVGLVADANWRVGIYSSGVEQRLGLVTTLSGKPERLILDEPVDGLNPQGVRWIRWLLRAHTDAGGTVPLLSHLIGEPAEVVDGVVTINGGRIEAWGGAADVMAGHPSLEEVFFTHVKARA